MKRRYTPFCCTWNCKHTIFPVVLGVSEPAHSPEELAAYARNSREAIEIDGRVKTRYEWTQEQRRTETAIRRQKDVANLAKASGDDVLRQEAQSHINTLQKHYARISAGAGLTQQPERAAVAGFQRVKTAAELHSPDKGDILSASTKVGGGDVRLLCRIDRQIYSCVAGDIATDEVVVTTERIAHSNLHDNAFDKYAPQIPRALISPDYIFADKHLNTGVVVKRLSDADGRSLQIVLRIKISSDPEGYKNSIISCWDISESRLQTYLRNRKLLYKSDEA